MLIYRDLTPGKLWLVYKTVIKIVSLLQTAPGQSYAADDCANALFLNAHCTQWSYNHFAQTATECKQFGHGPQTAKWDVDCAKSRAAKPVGELPFCHFLCICDDFSMAASCGRRPLVVDGFPKPHNIAHINTLRPRQDGRHFPDDILNSFSCMKIVVFWLKFHWNLFPKVGGGPINNKSSLVQIKTWRRSDDKQ